MKRYARFGVLLLLVLATYVAWSLLDYAGWTGLLLILVTCLTGIHAMLTAAADRRLPLWAAVTALLAVGLALVAALIDDERPWLGIASLLAIVLIAVGAFVVLRRIVLATQIGVDPILGAISVYALLGIMFAHLYAAIHHFQDASFFIAKSAPEASDFLFFSYTTLTTTGYGNLVPGGQPGEMFAGLEMLVGQIFLVTLIARLVALWKPGERLRAARGAGAEGPEG